MSPLRTVRDGQVLLRFEADVIASATSQRPGISRWSELAVYRLPSNRYVIWKIGRSVLAHRPECPRVGKGMVTWLEAGEEARVHREPCLECSPTVGDDMDPHTVLEATRYTVLRARDPQNLLDVLTNSSHGKPAPIVSDVLKQVIEHDEKFADWSRSVGNTSVKY